MKTIINIGKCGITAILALCILLGMVGTCMNVSATEEIATVVTDEATVVSTETIIILTEETTVTPKEATVKVTRTASELIPMMAQRCSSDEDYSDYDGLTFKSTAQGLNAMGIPFSGSGLGIVLLNPMFDIDFEQRGTDFCVFITDSSTGSQVSWFKVKKW